MFKVICIKEVNSNPDALASVLKVGNPYIVIDQVPCHCGCRVVYYILAEDSPLNCYRSDLFARVSNIDEVVIAEARLEAEGAELDAQFREIIHGFENV